MQGPQERLARLAREANDEHAQAQECFTRGVEHAIRAGKALAKAKSQVPHGGWGTWLAENFEGSERTAQIYMRMAKRLLELDDETRNAVAEMSLREAVKVVAEPRTVQVLCNVVEVPPKRIVLNLPEPEPLIPASAALLVSHSGPANSEWAEKTPSFAPPRSGKPASPASQASPGHGAMIAHLVSLLDHARTAKPTEFAAAVARDASICAADLEELVSWLSGAASELHRIAEAQR